MDLFKIGKGSNDDGVWMDVVLPNGEELEGVRIKLAGPDSDVYTKKTKIIQRVLAKKAARKGKLDIDIDEAESAALDLLVACTLDWEGITKDEQVLECTPENVKQLYTEVRWLRKAVDEFISDGANFFTSTK